MRIWYGNVLTGENHGDTYDCTGYIGRSMGIKPALLMLATKRSMGGPAILTECVLRIMVGGTEVWRHPNYKLIQWECVDFTLRDGAFYYVMRGDVVIASFLAPKVREAWLGKPPPLFKVFRDGKVHAAFETAKKRQRWLDFVTGKRQTP